MIEFIVKNVHLYIFSPCIENYSWFGKKHKKRCACRSIITKYVILKHRKRDVTRFNMLTWFSKWIFDGNVLKSRAVDRANTLDRHFVRFHPARYIPISCGKSFETIGAWKIRDHFSQWFVKTKWPSSRTNGSNKKQNGSEKDPEIFIMRLYSPTSNEDYLIPYYRFIAVFARREWNRRREIRF